MCHSLLTCRLSAEKTADNLIGILLYVICCFFLVAFNIFFLFNCFSIWLLCVLACSSLVNPVWDSLPFLDLGDYVLSHVREVFRHYLFQCFLRPFLSLSSGTPIMQVAHLKLSQKSLKLSSFLFIPFSFFCSVAVISTTLSSTNLSVFRPHLFCYWFLPVYFYFSYCILSLCLIVLYIF